MNTLINKLLKSNTTMITSIIIGTIACLGYMFAFLTSGYAYISLILVVNIFLTLSLVIVFISYANHDKNVMKFTIGSLLTLIIINWFLVSTILGYGIFSILLIVLSCGIYLIHLLINADRHSSTSLVNINQIICILYFLVSIFFIAYLIVELETYGLIVVIEVIAIDILELCGIIAVLFIETNLDTYRKARESKGWKENSQS